MCFENGYRIFCKPILTNYLKIVVSKATKYKWSDIPLERIKEFEQIENVIYNLKVGDKQYKQLPTGRDEKYIDKINELYKEIYNKLITKTKK